MWFKQVSVFELSKKIPFKTAELEESLSLVPYKPAGPSQPHTHGWVSPQGLKHDSFVYAANSCLMFCLKLEEKLLPATIVRQAVDEKVKQIETDYDRKVRAKERMNIREDMTQTLLPQAFSKFSLVHAYYDTQTHLLIVNSTTAGKLKHFKTLFERVTDGITLKALDMKKPGPIMTHWLLNDTYPSSFGIEKNAVLQDPNQESRVIRCKQQDLFVNSIQSLLKDGCHVAQLTLNWQERVRFNFSQDLTLRTIQYGEELLSAAKEQNIETAEQQFDTDFHLMTETLRPLLSDLYSQFARSDEKSEESVAETA